MLCHFRLSEFDAMSVFACVVFSACSQRARWVAIRTDRIALLEFKHHYAHLKSYAAIPIKV